MAENFSKTPASSLCWNNFKVDFAPISAVMGILNVTADSFSDGGDFVSKEAAVAHGIEMWRQGASIIDVGPESSRPGSKRIAAEQQIKRAIGVVESLAAQIDIPISIDTYLAEVAEAALDAGASIINDITAGADRDMFSLAADRNVPIVLMHIKGTPEDMHQNPTYDDVVEQVLDYLLQRANAAIEAGVGKDKIILDPGLGFGKTGYHNLQLLANLKRFVDTGFPVLVGASRKRFIGEITGEKDPKQRLGGTIAATITAMNAGAKIIRVHDVSQNLAAMQVAQRIKSK